MSFTESDKTKILRLKSSIASYYNLQMKKIGDKHLESFFFSHCVISGGMIASLFHDEPVNDIDVYAKESTDLINIKNYIIDRNVNIKSFEQYEIDSNGVKVIKPGVKPQKLITDNAVTLTNDVQFIYMDTFKNARARFDFIHCMPYYDIGTQKLYISEAQYDAIKNKQMIPNGSNGAAIKRIEKYNKRGWKLKSADLNPIGANFGVIAQEIGQLFPATMYINTST